MARQVIFAPKARMAELAHVLSETRVGVFMSSEIFWCKEFLVALGAAELAVLRRPR